jgi:hypothetical protein
MLFPAVTYIFSIQNGTNSAQSLLWAQESIHKGKIVNKIKSSLDSTAMGHPISAITLGS